MTVSFAKALQESIDKNQTDCNFKGVALGDSWISPADAVATWAPYLTAFVSVCFFRNNSHFFSVVFD